MVVQGGEDEQAEGWRASRSPGGGSWRGREMSAPSLGQIPGPSRVVPWDAARHPRSHVRPHRPVLAPEHALLPRPLGPRPPPAAPVTAPLGADPRTGRRRCSAAPGWQAWRPRLPPSPE
ncbi:hypothetical protein F751_2018 [Auxenochlorella protothecoides]|uniref:Uncharacterized protein n=1 Tax=Auxenochlorella protothecoides TaxID=3075 RepID=A0A087SMH8_AUXPR|nr:hypothetical protein F751_2018 [Auxenochlorella protothecoides]KFM26932.1 hypothetical protein F751_2018 [Auxenochlorella protothecoides]